MYEDREYVEMPEDLKQYEYAALPDPSGLLYASLKGPALKASGLSWVTNHYIIQPVEGWVVVCYYREKEAMLDYFGLKELEHTEVETSTRGTCLIQFQSTEERPDPLAEARDRAQRNIFVAMCIAREEALLRRAQEDYESVTKSIEQRTAQLIELHRKKKELYLEVRRRLRRKAPDRARLEAEYDRLATLPGVKKVAVTPESLIVTTELITINHEGKDYDIGEFQITYHIKDDTIRCENISDNLRDDCHHPHIDKPSYICLGNMVPIFDLVADKQFVAATILFLEFLNSYNPEDKYCSIEAWGEPEYYDDENNDEEDYDDDYYEDDE